MIRIATSSSAWFYWPPYHVIFRIFNIHTSEQINAAYGSLLASDVNILRACVSDVRWMRMRSFEIILHHQLLNFFCCPILETRRTLSLFLRFWLKIVLINLNVLFSLLLRKCWVERDLLFMEQGYETFFHIRIKDGSSNLSVLMRFARCAQCEIKKRDGCQWTTILI